GAVKQLIVWEAAPQEKRQSRCQLEIADSVDSVRCNFLGIAFHAEQEVWVDEHSAQRPFDSSVEIAFGTPFAIEGHRLVNFSFGDWPSIGAPHQRRENLSCTLFFLVLVLSGWPADQQPVAARCVLGALWRIRSGHRNLTDGGRRARMPPLVEARLCRLP